MYAWTHAIFINETYQRETCHTVTGTNTFGNDTIANLQNKTKQNLIQKQICKFVASVVITLFYVNKFFNA